MASKGHRRNILVPEMSHIAVGVARTDSGFYVTQVFAKQVGELDLEVPLLMSAAEYVTMVANVPGWTVTNFALSSLSDPVDLIDNLIGPDFVGEHNIRVRAEKIQTVSTNGSLRTITHWIYPSGPAVTIKGARES